MEELFAGVILDMISDAVDKPYQYRVPPELHEAVQVGCRVLVPFRSRKLSAYVISLEREKVVSEVRDILKLVDPAPVLTPELLELSMWLAGRYYNRYIETLRLCLPPAGERVKACFEEYILPLVGTEMLLEHSVLLRKRALRQSLLLEYLAQAGEAGLAWSWLRRKAGATKDSLHALVTKGLVKISDVQRERAPRPVPPQAGGELFFTAEQAAVWQEIVAGLHCKSSPLLLHGITGSGKTELYYRAASAALEQGRTALIMVPEIALTPQMIAGFRGRFAGQFALLHSSLSPGERYDQWWRVKRGEARVVLGARSAVFAPLQELGLIVLDEEHEQTYRQGDGPRYHARDVAQHRADYHTALLILGSATPSLETYKEVKEGKVKLLELRERVGGRPLPSVQVVDMRHEFHRGNRGIFSRPLLRAMEETLSRGEQLILFLNKRGFSSFMLCRNCGYVMQCPSCSVSLTHHTDPDHLQCHYCGYRSLPGNSCPACGSIFLRDFGLGTQRVEQAVYKLFPGTEVLRMDSDAMSRKDAHRKVWEKFNKGQASILIGTQMIAKGLDFPNVTLVGVVAADITLNLPDFRAGERTFQLLTQVAGRAGRGDKKGHVIFQTYNPEHYSIITASTHDFHTFVQKELHRRESLLYPPFGQLLLFTCSSLEEGTAREGGLALRASLEACINFTEKEELMGPTAAPLQKIRDYYRFQLLFKGEHLEDRNQLIRDVVWKLRGKLKNTRIAVDFNPLIML